MAHVLTPFHLAIPVNDLAAARDFYGKTLGCSEGRSAASWVDFNLQGHQLVCHLAEDGREVHYNPVDGDSVPVPHFGVVMEMPAWRAFAHKLTRAGITFVIEPHIRFAGQTGEQATMFFLDPSGNVLEFKAFADINRELFAS